MTRRVLYIMAKRPAAGHTKTRLCPPLSPERAADLYAGFLADVIELARAAAAQVEGLVPAIAYTPADARDYFAGLAPDFELQPQTGTSLGERLDAILGGAAAGGYDQVAAINSDSPSLPADYLAQAFTALDDPATDAVFGPCEDGGYYLIGLKQLRLKQAWPRLVLDVPMSTPDTLADTLRVADELGLRVSLLPPWYDVDSAAELERLAADPGLGRHTRAFLAQ